MSRIGNHGRTIGYRLFRADGTARRFPRMNAAQAEATPGDYVSRIKTNHNGTVWHERVPDLSEPKVLDAVAGAIHEELTR